ncbi:DgyrCDS9780 [Dimorphilus gyrociliatus]|uniref:DgyrCDS9780 n=1 Tax=Dimorphilus gyrociliatus TaxID=2664684 RepID=A0A7I8W0Q2_9ANNE|nr:DgyrCDS9780 [Dimorphilus gyrociliatus]
MKFSGILVFLFFIIKNECFYVFKKEGKSLKVSNENDWLDLTKCSKTCGTGIILKEKKCPDNFENNLLENGLPCIKEKAYFICNTQPCYSASNSHQDACNRYNHITFAGRKYNWQAFRTENECSLLCLAVNSSTEPSKTRLSFRTVAVDGTNCQYEKDKVCLAGECTSYGCDNQLNSKAIRDVCNVCNGDNSTCSLFEKRIKVSNLENGYQHLILVPRLSSSIKILEVSHSKNDFAVKNLSGFYYLNGNYSLHKHIVINRGNYTIRYNNPEDIGKEEFRKSLIIDEQINEDLVIEFMKQEKDPLGEVLIQFYLPNTYKHEHLWRTSDWSLCSKSCSRGTKTRSAYCVRKMTEKVTDDSFCEEQKPILIAECNKMPCPANWTTGPWQKCSEYCGEGIQYRTVTCIQQSDSNGTETKDDSECSIYNKPISTRSCKTGRDCPKWTVGNWTKCGAICGWGVKRRLVACHLKLSGRKSGFVSEALCDGRQKPNASMECYAGPCSGFEWAASEWGKCMGKCESLYGSRTRHVVCMSESGEPYSDEFCLPKPKPNTKDICKNVECNEKPDWYVSSWSDCSSKCGKGIQTRTKLCAIRKHGSILRVEDWKCDEKTETSRECNGTKCDGLWITTPFGLCSKSCGGGKRSRVVLCLKDECDVTIKPKTQEDCNIDLCSTASKAECEGAECKVPADSVGSCKDSDFGCCADGKSFAEGPFKKGCPIPSSLMCNDTEFGCCPDGVTVAGVSDKSDCPIYGIDCAKSLFGCCNDGKSFAHGPNKKGCANETNCEQSTYGCCRDGITSAKGRNLLGCLEEEEGSGEEDCQNSEIGCSPIITSLRTNCRNTKYGCCSDDVTVALTKDRSDCPPIKTSQFSCIKSKYECCPDGKSVPSGPYFESCAEKLKETCEKAKYGCCKDSSRGQEGPNGIGCQEFDLSKACWLNPERGEGHRYVEKWYFDTATGICQNFWYGSEGGNLNRFESEHECQWNCVKPVGLKRCFLPLAEGRCNQEFSMFYYDYKLQRCTPFIFSGCDGNENKFNSIEECETRCEEPLRDDVCRQPKKSGPCRGSFDRWFFDSESNSCRQFIYGGCWGNDNRFETKNDCEHRCLNDTEKESQFNKDVCHLNPDQGPCRSNLARWFYDSLEKTCYKFNYGGCKGNANRFYTKKACEKSCSSVVSIIPENRCSLPREEGIYCSTTSKRWYFSFKHQKCLPFTYFGCLGNANRFSNEEECLSECSNHITTPAPPRQIKCRLAPDHGPCNETVTAFYYNPKEKRCKKFEYGGCGGNLNRFPSRGECWSECSIVDIPQKDVHWYQECSKPPVQGPCNSKKIKHYYLAKSGTCRRFWYSGCGGNANRFESRKECDYTCAKIRKRDRCLGGVDKTFCGSRLVRWYYNNETERCEEFSYGGCYPNGNNFHSWQECAKLCEGYEPPTEIPDYQTTQSTKIVPQLPEKCFLRKRRGPCSELTLRFYYDNLHSKCRPFMFGGCDGNENNFQTQEECYQSCPKKLPNAIVHSEDDCYKSPESGECGAFLERYYWNVTSGICSRFMYGGCEGNGNNFISESDCYSFCQTKASMPRCPKNLICKNNCKFGYLIDKYGCETCECALNPCLTVLCAKGYECSLVKNACVRKPCPLYVTGCVKVTEKEGKCPDHWNLPASCRAECKRDDDCDGDFKCCSNGCGRLCVDPLSNNIQIPVEESPAKITLRKKAIISRALQNSNIVFDCPVRGYPKPDIIWIKDNRPVDQNENVYMGKNGSLHIDNIVSQDSGSYICSAANELGRDSATYTLVVQDIPRMYKRNDSVTIEEGYGYQITCPIIESSQFKITWRFNGRFLKDTSKILRISKTNIFDSGKYMCIASSLAGSTSYVMDLQVLPKLKAIIQEHNTSWPINYETELVCFSNHPNASITWLKDGEIISNSSTYLVRKVKKSHQGTYICQVQSNVGWAI